MAEGSTRTDVAPVTDRRPAPAGVLPRGMQTWLMAGLAAGMILIMFIVGRPDPPPRPAMTSTPVTNPDPERVRAYQEQLETLEAQAARQQAQAASATSNATPTFSDDPPPSTATQDPLAEERKRRAYESLFAGNVVLSRRPAAERPDVGSSASQTPNSTAAAGDPSAPSIDAIADAAVRATRRASGSAPSSPATSQRQAAPTQATQGSPNTPASELSDAPTHTDRIGDAGPRYRLLEGTVIDGVLTNRIDGSAAAPVNCLVTNAVYSQTGQRVLIPAGARLLGETKPVQAFGETRLAVAFHRLEMPDGSTYRLDQTLGLNQTGDAGLHDQVNQHYWSTFGSAAAVGLISGLAQFVGTAGLAAGNGNRTVVIAGGAADAASQASAQTMNRFLNRLPTVTIREGHRVKVYLTQDLELPAYQPSGTGSF